MISDSYREVLRETHEQNLLWGHGHGEINLPKVLPHLQPGDTVLDYGCGKGGLVYALRGAGHVASGYDPGIDHFSARPQHNFDVLVSFDVLEHVEPEHIAAVLDDMESLAKRALLNISLVPAHKTLTDGRNAHLLVRPVEWWQAELESRWFQVILTQAKAKEATFLCVR